jgi:hypothetical protein
MRIVFLGSVDSTARRLSDRRGDDLDVHRDDVQTREVFDPGSNGALYLSRDTADWGRVGNREPNFEACALAVDARFDLGIRVCAGQP